MIFEKSRFEIWNPLQHPLKHSLSAYSYTSPSMPGVSNLESALNWITKCLYPNTKPAVATPADLPLVGNTLHDYRVVFDDGDGRSAGYRWEQREGDGAPKWYKVTDMDWSHDSILASFMDITQDLFVIKEGRTDIDFTGAPIVGKYAGQTINGGNLANQNLTLRANSGDGAGAHTGFVQVDNHFRPVDSGLWDIGTATEKFKDGYFSNKIYINTLTLETGKITDSTGQIDFGDEDLVTLGDFTSDNGYFISTAKIGLLLGNRLVLAPGSITDDSGSISFGNENLSTTGTFQSNTITVSNLTDTLVLNPSVSSKAQITSSLGEISFADENLSGTGSLSFLNLTGSGFGKFGNLKLTANTLSSEDVDGNIILLPNGTGIVDIQKALQTLGITATGTVGITGQLNIDNLRFDGNTISSTDVDGNILLSPNGTGIIQILKTLEPSSDDSLFLGKLDKRFSKIFLSDAISDGTNEISLTTLLSFKDVNSGVLTRMSIFWDGTKWVASYPDTEVYHDEIGHLTIGDAGHTQFAMLAGRAGGQTLYGGTAASENLTLYSTAHATKGFIKLADTTTPLVNASYSGGWGGTDLGSSSFYFRNIYTRGEAFGLRLENVLSSSLPTAGTENRGRLVFAYDIGKAYVDTGTQFKVLGVSKFLSDLTFNGTDLTKDVDVSADITDARRAQWMLYDNANDYEQIFCKLLKISATTVRISTTSALPSGTYRLIGIE